MMITRFTKKIKSVFNPNKNFNKFLPNKIFGDDLFLISYPKSGNTWMRFILANLLCDNESQVIDFYTAISYVPEVGVHGGIIEKSKPPRIIKSHSPYLNAYPKVVYLMRDARDVYVSYYFYLRKTLPVGITFSQFLHKKDIWPCYWRDHVLSWLNKPNVLVIRYEDAYRQVRKMLTYWGQLSFDNDEVRNAITASSFERMEQLEKERGRPFKSKEAKQNSNPFMRKGRRGDWQNCFSKQDEAFLLKRAGDVMKRLSYIE